MTVPFATGIAATTRSTPSVGTHWSLRTLARRLGVGVAVVRSVLSPNRSSLISSATGKILTIRNSNPRCWRWSDCICDRRRTRSCSRSMRKPPFRRWIELNPVYPMKPHRMERLSHEYKRNGTASLLASWEVHSGQVRAEPIHRNNSATFIRFLRQLLHAYPAKELYIIADNGSSHRSKKTQSALENN